MRARSGMYAGCVWLFVAGLLVIAAYWGLGIAGPSALPTVTTFIVIAVVGVLLAAALWTGFGGRRVAAVSLALGFALIGFVALANWSAGQGPEADTGGVLFAAAIIVTSAYAYRYRYGS